jgi:hypothetical protein
MKFVQSLARERARCNASERRRGEAAYASLTKLWRGMEAATEGISDCGEPRLAELIGRAEELVSECRAAERRLGELLSFLHIEGQELAAMLGEEVN